jgi:hypothetical protein
MHFHHGPASDYRVLAAWPDYLEIGLRESLEPVVRGPEYDATGRAIRSIARQRIRRFPEQGGISRRSLAEDCTPAEIAGLTGLLFMYQHFISEITIDIIRLKQAFGGPMDATESKCPV